MSKALSFMISNGGGDQYSKYICRAVLSNEFKSLSKEEKKLTRESKWILLSSEKWVSPHRDFGEEFSDLASSILDEGEYSDYSVINKVKGKSFKDAVRKIGLNGTEALRELGVLITNTNCILGISKDAYEILNDDQQRSFFRILTQNSHLLSKIKTRFPLYEFIKRVISDEVDMDKILSFVQEELYRVPKSSDMIHFLDSLREVEVETEEKPIKEELRSIFYIFFKEFLTQESFASEVLPEIKLVNQKGNWKNTHELCFGEEGVAKTYLLEKRAFECFTSRPFDKEDNPTDDGATLNNLNDYFRDWEDRVPKSIVGTFLALIACGQQDIVEYSESLLGGRSVEGLLEEICPDTDWHQDQEPFVSIVEGEDFRVRNILGEWMTVQPPSIGEVKSVFSAGSPKLDLNDKLNLSLQIIALDEFDDNEKLIVILRNSIMKLIENIFEIENATECEKLLDQLCEKSQIGVEMAKIQAIDSGLGYLSNLTMGMERSSNGVLALLQEMEKAQTKKAEKSTSNRKDVREKAETEYREIESDVKKRFRELLETFDQSTPCEEEEFLIKAVRRKISEDCMYSIGSVPFEIFQNADDSVIQLDESVRNQSDQFEIIVGEDRIFFKHRGRSINSWSRTARSMTEARELGYHADLGKMLFLNSSSKRAESEVTGQFGLGFKSIYLLGNIPKVASGDLFFEIRAGFYPRILPFDETEELRNLGSLGDATQSATVIEIPTHDIDPLEAIDRFEIMAPYLPLFGKGIREVKVLINEQETIYSAESLHEKPIFKLFNDERVLRLGDVQKGCVILNLNENGFIKFEDLPSIWVTGPTHENHPFGIMLNCSRVKLDIGRSKIHQSIDQSELADELGNLIGKDLLELSKYFSDVSFQKAAGLEELDDYGFWESLWELMTELR